VSSGGLTSGVKGLGLRCQSIATKPLGKETDAQSSYLGMSQGKNHTSPLKIGGKVYRWVEKRNSSRKISHPYGGNKTPGFARLGVK